MSLKMTSVQVPMFIFNGEKIYGEFISKKLVFWISNELYLRIYTHVMTFLPDQGRGLSPSSLRRANAMKDFIQNWLIFVSGRSCRWILKDTVPEQFVRLPVAPSASFPDWENPNKALMACEEGLIDPDSSPVDFSADFSLNFDTELLTAINSIL